MIFGYDMHILACKGLIMIIRCWSLLTFFSNLVQDIALQVHYVIQGNKYNMRYYLADGIYPKWLTIVQTIHESIGPKKKYFAAQQEACRKYVKHV